MGSSVDAGPGKPRARKAKIESEFQILKEIGRGPEAMVYLVRRGRAEEEMALKVLKSQLPMASSEMLALQDRAAQLAEIHHEGICAWVLCKPVKGLILVLMPFIDGQCLSERIAWAKGRIAGGRSCKFLELKSIHERRATQIGSRRTAKISERPSREHLNDLLSVFIGLAEALHVGHAAGLLHQALRPSNIFVTGDRTGILMDFGLDAENLVARRSDGRADSNYLAPELVGAKSKSLDGVSETYSLAVTLYEALCLRRPHDAPTRARMRRVVQAQAAPDIRRFNPAVPRRLALILKRALSLKPSRRYQSAAEFAADLRALQRSQEPAGHTPAFLNMETLQRWWFQTRRHP